MDSSKYNQPLHFVCAFSTFLLNLTPIFYSQCIHLSLAASYHMAKWSMTCLLVEDSFSLSIHFFIHAIVSFLQKLLCLITSLLKNLLMAPHYLQSKSQTLIPGTACPCSTLNRFISHSSLREFFTPAQLGHSPFPKHTWHFLSMVLFTLLFPLSLLNMDLTCWNLT